MESETSDLLDRRMMQLFGMAHPEIKKTDLKDPNPMTGKDLKWDKMQKKLEEGQAMPELGLLAVKKRRSSLPTPVEASTI